MVCEEALKKLKEAKENRECLGYGICPKCGGVVKSRCDDHGIPYDRVCEECHENFH